MYSITRTRVFIENCYTRNAFTGYTLIYTRTVLRPLTFRSHYNLVIIDKSF